MAYSLSKWFFFSFLWLFFNNLCNAQIIPDKTLPQNSIVNSDCNTSCRIEGGTITENGNLFHSFEQFSVPANGEAIFNNNPNIKNIFTRVTGSLSSEIYGIISAQSSANLFFINPNGIMFGANARLNIGGSFLATTADSIFFDDNSQFSATNPQSSSLLTVSVPNGLQFGEKPGEIVNKSRFEGNDDFVGIQVNDGKTIALVGSGIALENGFLTAFEGRIELGSVTANSFVNLTQNTEELILSYDSVNQFERINIVGSQIFTQTSIDSLDSPSGNIQIYGSVIDLLNGSTLSSINNSESDGGNVFINAKILTIQDSTINTRTSGNGTAGNINISAKSIDLIDSTQNEKVTGLSSQSALFGSFSGNAGNLNINTNRLTIQNGARVSVSTFNLGKGGNLSVNAAESVEVIGRSADGKFASALFAESRGRNAKGDAGDLIITTGKLIVQGGGKVSVGSVEEKISRFRRGFSQGNGGELVINASESIEVSGFGFDEQGAIAPSTLLSESQGIGNAGNLNIKTPKLTVTNGSEVNVSATGKGVAGSLNIDAQDITIDRGTLNAETNVGNEGNITISDANTLLLRNNSDITTNAQDIATGGDITINSEGIALINNSNITAKAVEGTGGNINITTQSLFQEPGSEISATSEFGTDGTITIESPDGDPTSGLIETSNVPIDAATIFAQNLCKFENNKIAKGSSFIITGRGGLTPTSADDLENLDRVVRWANRDDLKISKNGSVGVRQRLANQTPEKSYPVIQQSQGWVTTADGSVWLVANAPETIPQNSRIVHPNCQT